MTEFLRASHYVAVVPAMVVVMVLSSMLVVLLTLRSPLPNAFAEAFKSSEATTTAGLVIITSMAAASIAGRDLDPNDLWFNAATLGMAVGGAEDSAHVRDARGRGDRHPRAHLPR